MKRTVFQMFGVSAAVMGAVLSYGDDRPARAAVEHAIEVKQVSGLAEYAYDSTGWRPLHARKVLHAGATVRTANGAMVLLAMEEAGSLVRVGPASRLELAKSAPAIEMGVTIVPLQAHTETSKLTATRRALPFGGPMGLVSKEVFWAGNN